MLGVWFLTDEGTGLPLKIDINDNTTSRILGHVRQILREVDIDTTQNFGLEHGEILQKYAAIQAALKSFEETHYDHSAKVQMNVGMFILNEK